MASGLPYAPIEKKPTQDLVYFLLPLQNGEVSRPSQAVVDPLLLVRKRKDRVPITMDLGEVVMSAHSVPLRSHGACPV